MISAILIWIRLIVMIQWARCDGRYSIDQVENRVAALIGARSIFNPEENNHDKRIQAEQDPQPVEAQRDAVHRAEDEVAKHGRPSLLTLGIIGLCLLEIPACIFLMQELRFENPERALFGFLLAVFVIWIIHWTFDQWRLKRYPVAILSSAALLTVATAIAFLRLQDASGGGSLLDIALIIITLALTMGAGLMAAFLINLRRPAVEPRRQLRKEKGRLRALIRRQFWAKAYAEGLVRKQQAWDKVAKRLRAAYSAEFKIAKAKAKAKKIANGGGK